MLKGKTMKVLNFGSLNLDYTYRLPHIVAPGETITSLNLEVYPGGKGLNQSVALAKAGADVYHAGQIGEDGMMLKETCESSGVDTIFMKVSETRSGNAIIQVDEDGQNCIILYPGANRQMTKAYIDEVLVHFGEGDVLLLQNEINELPYIVDKAYERKMKIALNPSPLDEQVFQCDLTKISLFLLNEVEGAQLTGKTQEEEILEVMAEKYPEAEIVLTLGGNGSIYCKGDVKIHQAIFKTDVQDTTGAGDTFTGFFIADYLKNNNPERALRYASMAASIAVSRKGAACSVPMWEEVEGKFNS